MVQNITSQQSGVVLKPFHEHLTKKEKTQSISKAVINTCEFFEIPISCVFGGSSSRLTSGIANPTIAVIMRIVSIHNERDPENPIDFEECFKVLGVFLDGQTVLFG